MPTSVAPARRTGLTGARPAASPSTDARARTSPVPPQARPLLPAAASPLAPAWLHGPPGPARVAAVFGRAAYLLRDDEVLPVLAPGALALPGGLKLGRLADLHALDLRVGAEVVVGGGRLHAAGAGLVVRRTWRPWSVPCGDLPRGVRDHALATIETTPGLVEDLPPLVVESAAQLLTDWRVERLVGLGPGLTPAGDDVLCGLLLGLRATGREIGRARLERHVIPLLPRTTALSATLLRQAAEGYAVPPVVDLLHAWHRDAAPSDLAELTAEVAAVGHSSGRALLLGLGAALAAPSDPDLTTLSRSVPVPREVPRD